MKTNNDMKNIHVLPTDKPSRLIIYSTLLNEFRLLDEPIEDWKHKRHIYITSDEEIKEGDYYLPFSKSIVKKTTKYGEIEKSKTSMDFSLDYLKKIILTTDQDLIKDGVQSIDDTFLEWFCNNPYSNKSCEWVEIKRNKKLSNKSIWDAIEGDLIFNNHNCGGIITRLSSDVRVHITSENGEGYVETAITSDNGIDTLVVNNYKVYEYIDYKIVIPKEEQDYTALLKQVGTKQETLEEAASKVLYNKYPYHPPQDSGYWKDMFKEGAKWQAERMYSEEDLKYAFDSGRVRLTFDKERPLVFKNYEEWFEQFKK